MSIQYGSLPITEIKYCDPQGTLKDVTQVARGLRIIWEPVGAKTNNRGVWTDRISVRFVWDSSSAKFITNDEAVFLEWINDYNGAYLYGHRDDGGHEVAEPIVGVTDESVQMQTISGTNSFTWSAS